LAKIPESFSKLSFAQIYEHRSDRTPKADGGIGLLRSRFRIVKPCAEGVTRSEATAIRGNEEFPLLSTGGFTKG